eukprot:Hpha_TRINITY_DN15513_c5_g5::TRINITY_DN15513_c5_g5_i2::g.107628::m.107628/K10396/KIF5; kinesin family member 5
MPLQRSMLVANGGADPSVPRGVRATPDTPGYSSSSKPSPATPLPRTRDSAKSTVHVCPRFCPVRDPARGELDYSADEEGQLVISSEFKDTSGKTDHEIRRYNFARVFDGNTTEDEIYSHFWAESEDKLKGGFNVAVLCYGQTGSGKTHTVSHLLPRMTQGCFEWMRSEEEVGKDVSYRAEVSYLQIYMDNVYDLLGGSRDAIRGEPLQWRNCTHDALPRPASDVTSMEQAMDIVRKGDKWRATSRHNLNERSSRSHTLYFLTMVRREGGAPTQSSTLTVVDLAGSERVAKTGSTGAVFDEGRSINKSLTTLRRVIEGLALENGSVPFRDNVLTVYLRESLSNAYFALVCCCSGAALDEDETRCSLQFACVAKRVQITRRQAEVGKLRQKERMRVAQFREVEEAAMLEQCMLEQDKKRGDKLRADIEREAIDARETAAEMEVRRKGLQDEAERLQATLRDAEAEADRREREAEGLRRECSEEQGRHDAELRDIDAREKEAAAIAQEAAALQTTLAALQIAAEEHRALADELLEEGDADEAHEQARTAEELRSEASATRLAVEQAQSALMKVRQERAKAELDSREARRGAELAEERAARARASVEPLRERSKASALSNALQELNQAEQGLIRAQKREACAGADAEQAAASREEAEMEKERLRFAVQVAEAKVSRLEVAVAGSAEEQKVCEGELRALLDTMRQSTQQWEAEQKALEARRNELREQHQKEEARAGDLSGEESRLRREVEERAERHEELRRTTSMRREAELQNKKRSSELRGELHGMRRDVGDAQLEEARARADAETATLRLRAAERRAAAAAAHAARLRADIITAEEEISAAEAQLPQTEASIARAKQAAEKQAQAAEDRTAELRRRHVESTSQLQARLAAYDSEAEGALARRSSLLEEMPRLQAELDATLKASERVGSEAEWYERAVQDGWAESSVATLPPQKGTPLRVLESESQMSPPEQQGEAGRRRELGLAIVERDAQIAARQEALQRSRAEEQRLADRGADMEVELAYESEEVDTLADALAEAAKQQLESRRLPSVSGAASNAEAERYAAVLEGASRALRLVKAARQEAARRLEEVSAEAELARGERRGLEARKSSVQGNVTEGEMRVAEAGAELKRLDSGLRAEVEDTRNALAGLRELQSEVSAARAAHGAASEELQSSEVEAVRRLQQSSERCAAITAEVPVVLKAAEERERRILTNRKQRTRLAAEARDAAVELETARRELAKEMEIASKRRKTLRALEERKNELSGDEQKKTMENDRLRRGIARMRSQSQEMSRDLKEESRNRVRALRLERQVGQTRATSRQLQDQGLQMQTNDMRVREDLGRKRKRLEEISKLLEQQRGARQGTKDALGWRATKLEAEQSQLKGEIVDMERHIRGLSQYCRSAEKGALVRRRRSASGEGPPRSVSPALSRSSAEGNSRPARMRSPDGYMRFGSYHPGSSDDGGPLSQDSGRVRPRAAEKEGLGASLGLRPPSRSQDMSKVPAEVSRATRTVPKHTRRRTSPAERRATPVERRTSSPVERRVSPSADPLRRSTPVHRERMSGRSPVERKSSPVERERMSGRSPSPPTRVTSPPARARVVLPSGNGGAVARGESVRTTSPVQGRATPPVTKAQRVPVGPPPPKTVAELRVRSRPRPG